MRAGVKRSCPNEEGEGLGEVVCTMNDVIMVEDGQCATGTVLKVNVMVCSFIIPLYCVICYAYHNIQSISALSRRGVVLPWVRLTAVSYR